MAARELSEEAQAIAALRKKRAEKASVGPANNKQTLTATKGKILIRPWLSLETPEELSSPTLKIMTWNMLAQSLVRRELFPTSDCLKSGQREGMLTNEVLTYRPDIACLQEVDRLEKHLPVFHAASYEHVYASGPRKKHGCLVLYKGDLFEKVTEKTIFFDDVDVARYLEPNGQTFDGETRPSRVASTIKTKNIGLIVALARKDGHPGCVIATSHAFWHPKYKYERSRQAGILVRAVQDVRASDERFESWPVYIAGDLNSQPTEATYALLVGNELLPEQKTTLQHSRVIHLSRDPSLVQAAGARPKEEEDEGAASAATAEDPDRVITNARIARPDDGLLSDDELMRLYRSDGRRLTLRSAYDEALSAIVEEKDYVFGTREPSATCGKNEPMYTSYTHFWQLTLDYIFLADPSDAKLRVVGVLKPHRKEDLGDGLPKMGVCGSDHVALMVEVASKPSAA